MTMGWLYGELSASGDPADAAMAAQLRAHLIERGRDIPLPGSEPTLRAAGELTLLSDQARELARNTDQTLHETATAQAVTEKVRAQALPYYNAVQALLPLETARKPRPIAWRTSEVLNNTRKLYDFSVRYHADGELNQADELRVTYHEGESTRRALSLSLGFEDAQLSRIHLNVPTEPGLFATGIKQRLRLLKQLGRGNPRAHDFLHSYLLASSSARRAEIEVSLGAAPALTIKEDVINDNYTPQHIQYDFQPGTPPEPGNFTGVLVSGQKPERIQPITTKAFLGLTQSLLQLVPTLPPR